MGFKSEQNPMFRSSFAESIFQQKYAHDGAYSWEELATTLVKDVCGDKASGDTSITHEEHQQLVEYISDLKFIPGGRYLYYAGRKRKFFNNCYALKALEDTREDWAELSKKSELCLSTGGGIGVDYSVYRASGSVLSGTGGIASGPIAQMQIVDDIGKGIMQGGSRRSAIYASLSSNHADVDKFLVLKNWYEQQLEGTSLSIGELKEKNFNFHAPMEFTNISVNYDTEWLLNFWKTGEVGDVFSRNVYQAVSTGEPGFSFNFFDKEEETLRNACTEFTSSDDSDVCNLGSINFGRIDSISELRDVVDLAVKFLVCGSLRAELPYKKVEEVREKNRRIGLGLMGLHEWLIKRGSKYEGTEELHHWLEVYEKQSTAVGTNFSKQLSISTPIAFRAVAPTGTIGILAGTTTGIEPVFATAYKRRYLKDSRWHYQYVIDNVAQEMLELYGVKPEKIETALDLARDPIRRLSFQANVQEHVDMAISSTINLPQWGSEENNEDTLKTFQKALARYSHRIRGFTCYPDGARGGQPLLAVPYTTAVKQLGEEFEENIKAVDICNITQRGGSCGV
jgi:ribonucleoside-diphosphate reductase alpha chain|tara:strand:+ start:16923 stop:18620 length:1698 start_codon:yes stop_codon:yes gene_type:complete